MKKIRQKLRRCARIDIEDKESITAEDLTIKLVPTFMGFQGIVIFFIKFKLKFIILKWQFLTKIPRIFSLYDIVIQYFVPIYWSTILSKSPIFTSDFSSKISDSKFIIIKLASKTIILNRWMAILNKTLNILHLKLRIKVYFGRKLLFLV